MLKMRKCFGGIESAPARTKWNPNSKVMGLKNHALSDSGLPGQNLSRPNLSG